MSGEKNIKLKEIWPVIEEKLNAGAEVTINPGGVSMKPLIIPQRDSVILKKTSQPLKKYDVALYRRKNGQFVLHRIVDIKKDGYVMCGDNQYIREYPVEHEAVIAVMKAVIRNNKKIQTSSFSYKLYSRVWVFLQRIHLSLYKIRLVLGKIKRKMLR